MATVAGLGDMAISPTNQTPSVPGLPSAGTSSTAGGGAQQGLGAISEGSQNLTQAVDQASQALDTINSSAGTNSTGMKRGGSVKSQSTAKTWHGFGKSVTGKNNHGF